MKVSVGGGGDFSALEEDVYLGRIYSVVDLGIQETLYGDKHQCVVTWEIPEELVDGLPHAISKFYTLSLHEKATFCKDVEAMTGKIPADKKAEFDPSRLIGLTAQLSISKTKNKDGYDRNKIEQVSKVMKGVSVADPINTPVYFDLDDPKWPTVFETLPEWLQKLVNKGSGVTPTGGTAADIKSEDIPVGGEEEGDGYW